MNASSGKSYRTYTLYITTTSTHHLNELLIDCNTQLNEFINSAFNILPALVTTTVCTSLRYFYFQQEENRQACVEEFSLESSNIWVILNYKIEKNIFRAFSWWKSEVESSNWARKALSKKNSNKFRTKSIKLITSRSSYGLSLCAKKTSWHFESSTIISPRFRLAGNLRWLAHSQAHQFRPPAPHGALKSDD